jgi:serine/threonine-protein kinase
MTDLTGKRLGKWIIDRELGRGGMGRVYLAHEEAPDGRRAAVKVLAAELAQDIGFLERFQREVAILQQLSHPHIVRLFESGCEDGLYYYAMEYLPGQNFEDLIQERGRLPWKEVLDIALQICPALKHAHDHGIIHRDLKPQNLLRSEDGTVKLTDFGIAKVFAGKQLTVTGGLVGTAEFLSPEQAAGKPVTHRSDLYSFGALLYTLLTGRTPFQGRSTLDLMHKHRYAQFDPPHRVVPEIPADLDKIVCSLLEKDPTQRPANGLVLQRQLETLRQKVQRREQRTVVSNRADGTHAEEEAREAGRLDSPGPATLMSQLVREELASQKSGGPMARFFNKPWVIVALFAVCVTLIIWRPRFGTSEKSGDDSHDPALKITSGKLSEVQRQYKQAKHLYLTGEHEKARLCWQNIVDAFEEVPVSERFSEEDLKCVKEARDWLNKVGYPAADPKRWDSVEEALARAREKRTRKEAERIWRALESLYWTDPTARHILDKIEKDRAQRMEQEAKHPGPEPGK